MSGSEADLLCAEPSGPPSARTGPRQSSETIRATLRIETKASPEMCSPVPQRRASFFEGEPPTRRKVALLLLERSG